MAHYQQLKFVEKLSEVFPGFFSNTKVLEVGSWSKYGSIRKFFHSAHYIGADVLPGPGVDIVCGGQDLTYPDEQFDLSISCECFEHNPYWLETFTNMNRMLRPGGMCVVTCASLGRKEHGTKRSLPDASLTTELQDEPDYYANLSKADFIKRVKLEDIFSEYRFFRNKYSKDLYFVGIKKAPAATVVKNHSEQFKKLEALASQITTEKGAKLGKRVLCSIANTLQVSLIPLIGDRNYRNAQHFFRKTF